MAYNNPAYGNAAYAGAMSGMLSGRLVTSTNAADYAQLRASALAIATAVDAAIPLDGGLTVARADLLGSICAAVWEGRYPTTAEATASSGTSAAIVALWNAAIVDLA